MSNYSKKRISVHNAQIDMELAEDAITPNGMLLVPSGTTLTEKHLFRMNLYQIMSIVIKVYEEEVNVESPLIEYDKPVVIDANQPKTESFKHFKKVFETVESGVKTQLTSLKDGQLIDKKSLLASTDALMSSLRLKSELFTYMNHLKSEDNHTYVHSINVSMLCNIFGHWLKMSPSEIEELTLAGLIHDVGKTQINANILNKPGRLTEDEFNEMKTHAQLGYDLIKNQPLSENIKLSVLMHHERNDGTGYPIGLKGDAIPDFAKIIAILDVYDAMTSSRSYHKKFSPFKVIQMFEQESYGFLDTKFLFIFLENIAHYYLGETARLSDGTEAKIVFIHNTSPSRPIVQAGTQMIDLLTNHKLNIEEIL